MLKIKLEKDNLTQITCKHLKSTFPGAIFFFFFFFFFNTKESVRSFRVAMVTGILCVFEDTLDLNGFVSFWPVLKKYFKKKKNPITFPGLPKWAKKQ